MITDLHKLKPDISMLRTLRGRWRQHPAHRGCLHHYLINEGAGADLYNAGSKAVAGSLVGGVSRLTSRKGQILDFDGSDDYGTLGDVGITGSGPRTISFWANIDAFGTALQRVMFSNGETPATSSGGSFQILAEDNAISVAFNGHRVITPTSALSTGVWYFITVVVPAGVTTTANVLIYIDGQSQSLSDEAGSSQTLNTQNPELYLGAIFTGTPANFFDGRLDDIRIYNRGLSQTEINRIRTDPYLPFRWAHEQIRRPIAEVPPAPPGGLPIPVAQYSYRRRRAA